MSSTSTTPLQPSNNAVSCGTRIFFRWTINDFSDLLSTRPIYHSDIKNPGYCSSAFPSVPSKSKTSQFKLLLFPKGVNANLRAYVSIGLKLKIRSFKPLPPIPVRYRLSLVNSKTGCRHNTKEWLDIFSHSNRFSMFGRFISRRELYDLSNGFVLNDKLIIHCEMTILGINAQAYTNPIQGIPNSEISMAARIREMVWGSFTKPLDYYVNANLENLSALAKSQPKLMTKMIRDLASNNRLIESDYIDDDVLAFEILNCAIHDQVDETLSYTYRTKICDHDDEFSSWSPLNCAKSVRKLKQYSRREMLNILSILMVSGKRADLFLVLGDQNETVLPVHSSILLNRSSAFDSVLLHEIIEMQKNLVSILDVSSEVFDQLIHYLYTGKVPLLKKYQYELLNLSIKYDFDVLKQMSALALFDQVTTENVLSTLPFAHSICAVELKRACLDYATDHATQLVMNFDLRSLKPELVEEMFRDLTFKSLRLDWETTEMLNDEILGYEKCTMQLETQFYADGIFINKFLRYKILRNRILRDETIRKYLFPSIQQQQQQACAKFDYVEESASLTTRNYGESRIGGNVDDDSFTHIHPGLPDYRIGRIPRVVSRNKFTYQLQCDWHEFNVSFESSNVKTVMSEPNCSVTVQLGVSLIDSDLKRRYSTEKWILVTPTSGQIKVRGFVSDHILKDPANGLEYWSEIPSDIEQYMSVYESVEVQTHAKYMRSIDPLKQMSLKRVLLDLRTPFDREAVKEPIPSVPFEVLNLLLGDYLYDDHDGEQKRWGKDLLVSVAKYGIDYVKSTFENVNISQIANENVLKLLYYSSLCGDGFNRLHQVCLRFVIEHATSESAFNDYWKVVAKSRTDLLVLFFSLLANSKNHHNSAVTSDIKKKQFNHVYETLPLKVSNRIEETVSYTHLSLHHIVYDWPIDSIISTLIKPHSKLVSPKFCAPEKSSLKFRITKLESSRDQEDLKKKMFATNLVLKRDRPNDYFDKKKTEDAIIRYKVSFEYAKETVTSRDYVQCLELGSNYIYLSNDLSLPVADLLEYYSENMLETNKFNIRCEITLLCGISAYDLTKPTPKLSKLVESSRKRFFKSMNRLLKSDDDDDKCDVTLVVRGTELKVHGIFLAKSPVLEALVAQSNRISILDLSIEAFVPFVQYLYTGKVQSLDKYAKELLIVARKYKLDLLVQMCQLELS